MTFRSNTRARLMASGAAGVLALLAMTGAAQAQTAPQEEETQVDEIVVTGIRASIANSIAAKARNTSIVEVITAEDIGKLPDVSIAESLARLPGLTVQRLDGRGQLISIRGLGPDFTTALLNGREQVTTGDNRGVEFDQYPSELLGGVTVYKTPDAQLIGQGLAGTVDLQTIRPLAFGRRAIAANVRYEQNDIGALNSGTEDNGNRYSLSYIDQFADGTIGVALGYAHIESPYQSERYNAWGYPTVDLGNDLYGEQVNPPPAPRTPRAGYSEEIGQLVLGGSKPYVMSSELQRDGFVGTVEFRPNDRFHSTFDGFYSEFQNTQILRGIELPLYWGGSSGAGCPSASVNPAPPATATCRPAPRLQPTTTVDGGLITAGTFTNVKGVIRNDVNTRDSTITSLGWNTVFDASDDWSLMADLNYSKVERNDVVLETYSGTGRDVAGALDTIGYAIDSDGSATFTHSLNYADPNLIRLTSPQGWGGDVIPGGQDGYLNTPSVEDEIKAVRLQATRQLNGDGPFTSIKFGVNVSEREKSFVNDQFFLGVPGGASAVVPAAFLLPSTELTYLGLGPVISYDALGLVNSGFYNRVRNPNADVQSGNWEVTEKVNTAYLQLAIDHTLWSMPLTGNIGLQYVYTDQSSNGFAASGTGATTRSTAVSGGLEYQEFLPSSNFILEVGEDQYVRFAAARTLARSRMDDMRASRNFGYDSGRATSTDINNSPWSGGGGNPELKPTIADVVDLSYERYFANRTGYVSLAGFYKYLETFVYNRNQIFDFTGYPIGPITPANPEPALRQGLVGAPDNGDGGYISGIEFALSVPLNVVHPALEGFGFQFSASQTSSEIKPDGINATPLPGLSETVANLTVYYEANGFQARISDRYRSDFLGEVAGFGNGRTLRSVAEENVIDAQIGYEFQSGPLDGASVLFQVNNLTDEPFSTFQNGDERQVIDYQTYGRTFLIGLNYRY
ncbi:TonB-dependent receptor [Brevundimonas subvibrioides]|uniref:TonB-dependent receptor n=1 Tax=Brevundimonas subvibrioides (strain ATCC 15264 / DSM 4735 / LMG 14903 / NBRC 16000 / CB 81) TaxID=633149 RepID=D9QNH5_BRESC|nr:TonB-dependent receptor [Brevundimonas subvibrioides ATCC 15264]